MSNRAVGVVVLIPTYPVPSIYSPVVPFGDSWIGPVVDDPIVSLLIVSVSIILSPPRSVSNPEILAFPFVPFKKMSALAVDVVD